LKKIQKSDTKYGVLIFVYYSGHGVLVGGCSHGVCVDSKKVETLDTVVNIDLMVGCLAAIPDTYVILLFDAGREYAMHIKLDRDIISDFGGDSVRIYSTAAGTRSVIEGGYERDDDGNVVPIDPWKSLVRGGSKGSKGTKVTSKFIKHADKYGFPDFPQGFSFWAWRTDVKQFQVDVVQNCTKTVNFIECHEKDTVRMYQTKYLLSQKEVELLIEQFDKISNKTGFISWDQFMKSLTVFGLNWPHNKPEKDMPQEFVTTLRGYFDDVHEDNDNETLSMDEFFLLFMRLQLKLNDLNNLLKSKRYLSWLRVVNKDDYIFKNENDEQNKRWRVEKPKLEKLRKKK